MAPRFVHITRPDMKRDHDRLPELSPSELEIIRDVLGFKLTRRETEMLEQWQAGRGVRFDRDERLDGIDRKRAWDRLHAQEKAAAAYRRELEKDLPRKRKLRKK